MIDSFQRQIALLEPPDADSLVTEFWRKDDPILNDKLEIVRGGMWEPQRSWWDLPNFVRMFVAGLGGGKTTIGAKRMIALALQNAPVPVAAVSPTYTMARRTIIQQITYMLAGKQQMYGRKIFRWRYNKTEHEFSIEFHGREAKIYIYSGENPALLKGPNLAAAWMDEPFIQDREVFTELVSRIRHPDSVKQELNLTGCVLRNTKVLPRRGMTTIGTFDQGSKPKEYQDLVVDLYGSNRSFHQSAKFFNNGFSETRRITVENGYQLECTLDHPILVMGDSGKPEWRRSHALRIGDQVAIGRGMEVWGNIDPLADMKFPKPHHATKNFVQKENLTMTEDLAYFMGLWIAEGSLEECGRISICCGDNVHKWLSEVGVLGVKFSSHEKTEDCVTSRVSCKELVAIMQHLGMPLVKAPKKFIPQWVFEGRREWALAFLAGMYDGDGHVNPNGNGIGYTSTSEQLIRDLQCLLLNLGVTAHLSHNPTPPTEKVKVWSDRYQLVAGGNSAALLGHLLPLRIQRKRRKLTGHQKVTDQDKVPNQGSLLRALWEKKKKAYWRGRKTKLQPNQFMFKIRKEGTNSLSYTNLQCFVDLWKMHEPEMPEEIKIIESNLHDKYYWAGIIKLEASEAETVDFCIPDTHSFWSNGFISHNSPENLGWGHELSTLQLENFQDVGTIHASTRANRALREGYAKNLEGVYSEKAAQAYVEGQFVNLSEGVVYYAFDMNQGGRNIRSWGTTSSGSPIIPDGAEVGVGMDFNVNPFAFCTFWRKGNHMHFFAEHELPNADTQYACQVIREKYPQVKTIYPDISHAQKRSTNAPDGKSDVWYIKNAGFEIGARSTNPTRKDRYNATNGKLHPKTGETTCTIEPTCKKLIKYLGQYTHEDMNTEAQKAMSHLLDAFSLPIAYLYPVSKETLEVYRLSGI